VAKTRRNGGRGRPIAERQRGGGEVGRMSEIADRKKVREGVDMKDG